MTEQAREVSRFSSWSEEAATNNLTSAIETLLPALERFLRFE